MLIYNITINIDENIQKDWLQWMKEIHIPKVMNCKLFVEYKILKLIVDDEGHTYSIQYSCKSMKEYEVYQTKYALQLQKEHTDKFKNQFVAFRTLLEEIE